MQGVEEKEKMKLTKLTKESNIQEDTAKIIIELEVSRPKGYEGFDVFPDKLIPDLFVAASRKYIVKKGKVKERAFEKYGCVK